MFSPACGDDVFGLFALESRLARNGIILSVTRDFRERVPTRVSGERSTPGIQLREEISGCTPRRDVNNLRVEHRRSGSYIDEQPPANAGVLDAC